MFVYSNHWARRQRAVASEPRLHAWRVAEVLDEGSYINALHSPLRCGDVFQHTQNQSRYVLLAQPCDLVIRGKEGADFGKRRRDEADLVLIEEGKPDDTKRESNFVIGGVGAHGESWQVNFRRAISVNLRVLELAVFDREGRVNWRLGQRAPIHLLPGWKKRFQIIETRLGRGHDPDAMGPCTYFDDDHDLCGEFADAAYSFPLSALHAYVRHTLRLFRRHLPRFLVGLPSIMILLVVCGPTSQSLMN